MDQGGRYSQIPIPTYEEATSSRPTSSSQYRGPQEVSDDAERQGLLHESNQSAYRPPTVESARSSVDSDLQLPEVNGDDDRRQIEELDYLDPGQDANGRGGVYHRARLRSQFSKHLANISATFSSLRLPFRSLYTPVATGDTNTEPTTPSNPRPRRPWLPQLSNPWNSVPAQYRLSAPTFARLCGLFTIMALIYVLFALDMLPNGARQIGRNFDPESVRQFVQENVNPTNIQEFLRHITSYDHVAGTEGDLYLAKWIEGIWAEGGGMDDMAMWKYWVYLNYPTKDGRSVKIVEPEGKKWTAKLEEEQVDDSKTQTWAWHGHSKSAEATGHLVFANKGRREDFKWLKDYGVETKGCIALIRYASDILPGLQVKAAEEAGCVGALLYSDAAGDGDVWPDSAFRPADSVQRADVAVSNWVLGDPLTPGRASRQNARREEVNANAALPQIPSLPLSWRDAEVLINSLQDVGVRVPNDWIGGVGSKPGRHWYSGASDGRAATIVELKNDNDESTKQRIYNLHALFEGLEQPQKKLIVGARRDAWCFGSATGTAMLMEVANIFAELRKLHWRPLRSIEFVSWDAGMFGAVGATEYVEDNVGYLRDNGVAYLNIDPGVFGNDFTAEGSPLLRKALMHVLGRVTDPGRNDTLKHVWRNQHESLNGLSSSSEPSDALPFQSLAGTSVLDFGFKRDDPNAYPRGSCYETYDWMRKFGDNNDFSYHQTLAQIWALLILEIADRPLIPFDLKAYADTITTAVNDLEKFAMQTYTDLNPQQAHPPSPAELKDLTGNTFDLAHLHAAASQLRTATKYFHTFEDAWSTVVMADGGLETSQWAFKRLDYNNKIAHFETDLLDLAWDFGDGGPHGVPGREQFKHVLWGPRAWGQAEPFPGVRDAVESGDWKLAQRLSERAARVIRRAGKELWEDPECEGEWCDG
jgi:hypothetical protein